MSGTGFNPRASLVDLLGKDSGDVVGVAFDLPWRH